MVLTTKHRWWLLGGTLALTLTAAGWLEGNDSSTAAVVESGKSKAPTAKSEKPDRAKQQEESVSDIKLGKLQRQPIRVAEVGDVFASKSWYTPPPPPPPGKPVPPPAPVAPPLPFTYVGKLVEEGKLTVFLAIQDRNYTVKEGDVIDGTYHVDELKAPVMTLTYLPLKIQQTLQIGEVN